MTEASLDTLAAGLVKGLLDQRLKAERKHMLTFLEKLVCELGSTTSQMVIAETAKQEVRVREIARAEVAAQMAEARETEQRLRGKLKAVGDLAERRYGS